MGSAMGCQVSEAQPALRVAIENAWYSLHVAKDPAPPTRARIWWDLNVSPEAKQASKYEFTVWNVRRTHEALDATTAAAMHKLYEDAIDSGGHPNERGVASSLRIDRSPGAATIGVGFLHPNELAMKAALKATVDIAIGVAKTIALIYPERFRIMGVHEGIDQLVRHSSAVCSRHAQLHRRAS
jgi:hypothetical protein